MSTANSAVELLTKQHNQMTALEALLIQENEILQQHQPEALTAITQQKNELLIEIQNLDQVLAGHKKFIENKTSDEYQQILAAIEALLAQCQKQNTVNGQIIQHSQLAVERMKTSLLESNNKSSITYDNKGKKSGGLSSLGIKA